MSTVDDAWQRIQAWLAGNAPATLATLRPPAAPGQVVAAEAELGLAFPTDLTASLRRRDGATPDHDDTAWTCFGLPPYYRRCR
jgi:cell wall assembly regulator SMI1